MDTWNIFARFLIGLGTAAIIIGLLMLLFGKVIPFGRLPGDIHYQKENFTFYFPLASGLLLSLVLTFLLNLFLRR